MSASEFVHESSQTVASPFCLSDVVNDTHLGHREELREQFAGQKPFSFLVLDRFLNPHVADALADEFPPMQQMAKIFREPWAYKGQLSDIERRQPVATVFQSPEFRDFVSDVTGIQNLISDPMLAGAGFHQFPRRGFQDPHVDPNFHPFDKRLHRRLNFLVYLTRAWHTEWGGEFEVWDDRNHKSVKRVACFEPRFNRAILFYSSHHSWHSVSKVRCPQGVTRKSLAITLYTTSRPPSEVYRDSSAIWQAPHSVIKRLTYPLANAVIALLKPHAALLRRLRPNVFDASGRFAPRRTYGQDSSASAAKTVAAELDSSVAVDGAPGVSPPGTPKQD